MDRAEEGGRRGGKYAFHYPCTDSCYVALDAFTPWTGNHERTAWLDGCEQRVAFFESAFQARERFLEGVEKPC